MNTIAICEKCGTRLERESELPCPGCLMKLGMANWGDSLETGASLPPTQAANDGSTRANARVAEIVEAHFPGLEIVELLGEGGMGMVFRAQQTSLERDVAVKVIRTDHQYREAFENRFAREARALASLNHPNIVTVHDFGKTEDFFFLIMEFVDGINLRELLAGQQISAREALEIIPQICDALQYAHDQGVVHRDIKPENILLDKNGRVKIADYGLAKLINEEGGTSNLTQTHHVMGTPHYMAPEQVEKPLSVDHRADIYSLGVVIYEMLTGELPLGRFDLPSQKTKLDPRVDDIVIHTLEKEPARRYQQVNEVKTDFQTVLSPPTQKSQSNKVPLDSRKDGSLGTSPAPVTPSANHLEVPVGKPLSRQRVGLQKPASRPEKIQPGQPVGGRHGNPYESRSESQKNPQPIIAPQTYLNAIYLLISFPLALITFILAVTSIAIGLPLCIFWVGFFVLFIGLQSLQLMHSMERVLCRWLLGEEIFYRNPIKDQNTLFERFMAVITSGSTWWGILYSFIRLPWGIFCFVSVLVFFTVPLLLVATPLLITQSWFAININDYQINTMGKAIIAALLAFPVFYIGIYITNGLAIASGKMSKFFLTRC